LSFALEGAVTYRDIVVQADASEASGRRSAFAARLARRFNAHLAGLFLRPSLSQQYFNGGPAVDLPIVIPESATKEYNESLDEAERQARASFEAAAREVAVRTSWLSVSGDYPQDMIDCMRRVDLTVFPRERFPNLADNGFNPAELGIASGRPMIVLPDAASQMAAGRRILIGWNGTREASRALADAWPFMAGAERVSLLIVGQGEDAGPAGMLQRHFEHHDIEAEIIVDRAPDATAGEAMLEQAARLGADLIVMGLYGHSRLQELLLGGASRKLLKEATVPVLVSH
jgi:nucleotide-binding universal stress UspA family protein